MRWMDEEQGCEVGEGGAGCEVGGGMDEEQRCEVGSRGGWMRSRSVQLCQHYPLGSRTYCTALWVWCSLAHLPAAVPTVVSLYREKDDRSSSAKNEYTHIVHYVVVAAIGIFQEGTSTLMQNIR